MSPLFLGHTVDKSRLYFPKREIRVQVLARVRTYLKNAFSCISRSKKYHALTGGFSDLLSGEIFRTSLKERRYVDSTHTIYNIK